MKKILITVCGIACLGGIVQAGFKKGHAQIKPQMQVVAQTVKVDQSATAFLKVLDKKYAKHLPKKVKSKVDRKVRKELREKPLDAYQRSLAFIKVEQAKQGSKK